MGIVIDYSNGVFEAVPSGETVGTITGNATLDLTSGNLFNHTPSANVTFVFNNPPTTGSAYDMTLKVVGANVATGYDLANASYDNKDFSPSEDTNVHDIAFKDDGTKLYVVGSQNDKVYQYSLSTAYDISTASYDSKSFLVSSQSTLPTGLSFKTDGTRMFIFDFTNSIVYQYNLSTAWDVSTASYSNTSFTLSGGTDGFDLDFSTDGTKFIVTFRGTGDKVVLYNLSTAWDISTASFGSEKNVNAQTGTFPAGGTLNADGTKMFVANYSTKDIYQYSLSTAFDLSTASYDSVSFQITSLFSNPSQMSLAFNSDGTKMYSVAGGGNRITQYSTSSSALATIAWPSSVKWAGGTAPSAPASGAKDVYNFFTLDGGTTYYGFQAGDAMA
jgi:sugar lactone lactonase YvrE